MGTVSVARSELRRSQARRRMPSADACKRPIVDPFRDVGPAQVLSLSVAATQPNAHPDTALCRALAGGRIHNTVTAPFRTTSPPKRLAFCLTSGSSRSALR